MVQFEQIKCMDGAAAEQGPFFSCVWAGPGRAGGGVLASFSSAAHSAPSLSLLFLQPPCLSPMLHPSMWVHFRLLKFSLGPNHLFATTAPPAVSGLVLSSQEVDSRDSLSSFLHLPRPASLQVLWRGPVLSERPPPRSAGEIWTLFVLRPVPLPRRC